MKKPTISSFALVALMTLAGCASQQQILQGMQGEAVESALARGRFELQCPTAQGSVLSQELMQPLFFGGPERGLYTVGVAGCGQHRTYQIICPEGRSGCFSADTLSNIQ
ncbi:hypothetical protein [Accumulibacter sp.]|uniref:hypothetical protein n=1 Tax=Accumulibacter sp. TaxID=2053492 RepID=UPI001A3754F5|nr:hypothetical protein [Accumulibacter sp.]MBL8374563.1 hypothetical protein [Accumulibacter sp.]